MATIGRGVYAEAVHEWFEGLRTYDAERAAAVLAEDADLRSPWNDGTLTGRDKIQELLEGVLSDPKARPSFTIVDMSGDGNVVKVTVSVSNRFGERPKRYRMDVLHLKGVVHQVVFRPA